MDYDDNTHPKTTNEEQEESLFKQEVDGVTALRQHQTTDNRKTDKIPTFTKQFRRRAAENNTLIPTDDLSDAHTQHIEPEQSIEHMKGGLQSRRFKLLKQGKIPFESSLDLHGHTIKEARELLLTFLSQCQDKHCRCARVIHGKSHCNFGQKTTIKSYVNQWLKQISSVQAFSSCLQRDGGCGAVYVLLKTHR